MIDKEIISDIKNSVNIVEIIGEVVALTKAGRNYLGLCPFHGEKTPSFNVVEEKQFYHCFGCGKSGDVFKFIEEYRGVSFMDAVQIVADRAGFPLEIKHSRKELSTHTHPHQALYDIHAEAARFYHAVLMTTKIGEEARSYLYERGLTDEVIKHFQIGLAPNENNYLYKSVSGKFDEQVIMNSGLFNLADNNLVYDAFQNRIMFPLANDKGQVIAFSGRIWQASDIEQKVAKYKNSRSTPIFNKSYELYHLDKAKATIKKSHEIYLMEGFMDVIAAYRAGIENAVASMGTALTHEHVEHLRKFAKKIILTYDGDKAGQAATAKALNELYDLSVEIVRIPDNMDPDEFIKKNSADDLQNLLTKTRISDIEFLLNYLKPDNIENLQAQIEFVEQMSLLIAQVQSITAQNSYIYMLAELLPDFDYQQVEQTVNNHRLVNRRVQQQQSHQQVSRLDIPVTRQVSRLIKAESHLLQRMIDNPVILNDYRLRKDFHFATVELQTLYDILKTNGEVTPQDLSEQNDSVQQAWYRVLEENLPEEVSEQELIEVEQTRDKELLRKENQLIGKKVREASHSGDADTALEELERFIAQKRRME
ncbi:MULTISPECIES: DNA primase [Streptococcus]|uniref:DNA primase n=1 Tax=Streptococcus TaxID=1301 RepID=UPI0024770BB8|nr:MULTISPECIES: DNA primase [Streptococcus]MED5837362.1 DNA primase [Streptococcus anginosus]MED5843371.1 DNA primase [Streptococcus anginosus]MED5847229.1 DNA primase [Streptococcus anginosus]MED5848791.1 DNA primase [Streptococcus anginosus]MED5854894.1 DNA primase [Streptococcus anginosus]